MHVLFLTDNFAPETNAPATRVHEHCRRWVELGHRVTVVTGAPNFPEGRVHAGYRNRWLSRQTLDGIEVLRVKTFVAPNRGFALRTLDFLSFMCSGFLGGLLPRDVDVVVATSPQLFTAVAGWGVAALKRRPFVFELRDLWPASIAAVGALRGGRLLRALERLELFLYRRATRIVSVTHAFRDDLMRRGIDGAKIDVVTNGADLRRFEPGAPAADLAERFGVAGRFVVGYLGTHGMAHDLENVLAAAALLRDRPQVRFLFVGAGAAKERLVAEAARRGLDNVVFHPPQPRELVPDLWRLCDVALVHLRDDETFRTVVPSKTFEALASGRPVLLVAPEGEASALVREHGCGTAVPPARPAELARAVRALCDAPERCRELGEEGAKAAEGYGREHLADRYAALLRLEPAPSEERAAAAAGARRPGGAG